MEDLCSLQDILTNEGELRTSLSQESAKGLKSLAFSLEDTPSKSCKSDIPTLEEQLLAISGEGLHTTPLVLAELTPDQIRYTEQVIPAIGTREDMETGILAAKDYRGPYPASLLDLYLDSLTVAAFTSPYWPSPFPSLNPDAPAFEFSLSAS